MGIEESKILSFYLGKESYAVDISQVERIIEYKGVTKVPDSLPFMDGVITYENNILPILDLCNKYKIQREEEKHFCENKIIVFNRKKNKFGIRVSAVKEVVLLEEEWVKPVPELLREQQGDGLSYICNIENTIVFLLDLSHILSEEESQRVFQEE